jgi:hypothetical protein
MELVLIMRKEWDYVVRGQDHEQVTHVVNRLPTKSCSRKAQRQTYEPGIGRGGVDRWASSLRMQVWYSEIFSGGGTECKLTAPGLPNA